MKDAQVWQAKQTANERSKADYNVIQLYVLSKEESRHSISS
jgi:hypothetical protein